MLPLLLCMHPASHFVYLLGQSPFGHLGAKISKKVIDPLH